MRRIFLVLLASCSATMQPGNGSNGDDGSGDTGSGGGGPVADYVMQLDQKFCDIAFTCKPQYPTTATDTFETVYGASSDDCTAAQDDYYEPDLVQSDVDSGTIKWDANAAADCLANIAYDCSKFWTDGPSWSSQCFHALVGTIPDGMSCTSDYECVSPSSICDTTGVCAAE